MFKNSAQTISSKQVTYKAQSDYEQFSNLGDIRIPRNSLSWDQNKLDETIWTKESYCLPVSPAFLVNLEGKIKNCKESDVHIYLLFPFFSDIQIFLKSGQLVRSKNPGDRALLISNFVELIKDITCLLIKLTN